MQGLPPLVQAKSRPRCRDSLPKGMRILMPSAALAMQSMGCRNHLFKLNKDHSGHSGQVAMLLMHAGLDYESVLRTALSNMTHFLLCVQVMQHTARWRATQGSLDDSALQIMGACCILQDCGGTDFGLKCCRKTVQNLLHPAHETPM